MQRSLPFEITVDFAWSILEAQGHLWALSGVPLKLVSNNDRYYEQTASLDRKDSSKGYTPDNVQWVHKRVNFLKGDYSEEELLYWCKAIYRNLSHKCVELNPDTLKEHKKAPWATRTY